MNLQFVALEPSEESLSFCKLPCMTNSRSTGRASTVVNENRKFASFVVLCYILDLINFIYLSKISDNADGGCSHSS
jgi:hypothetical protein